MRSRQLTFVFADSPQGGKEAGPMGASAGKAFLLHIVDGKTTSDLSRPGGRDGTAAGTRALRAWTEAA
jgi:hypothetical protein